MLWLEKGEFVLIEFTGKEKNTGKVFETTNKETAKKTGIYSEGKLYEPIAVIAGEKQMKAGKKLSSEPKIGGTKTMKVVESGFKIEPQKYKGNAVLNANRS